MRRKTEEDLSVSVVVLEKIKENFQIYNRIYFDEILGNVLSVYKENCNVDHSMKKAHEFYKILTNILNMDGKIISTLLREEFVQIIDENMEKLACILENHVDEDTTCPHQPKNDGMDAFSVLIKNKRRTQDDRALIISNIEYYSLESTNSLKLIKLKQLIELEKLKVYAIFDGHNGFDVSNYGCLHLGTILMEILQQNFNSENTSDIDLKQILLATVDQLNRNIELRHPNIRSGSTITVCMIYDNWVYTAWRGDSQAVLINNQYQIDKINLNLHQVSDRLEQNLLRQYFHENVSIQILDGVHRTNGALLVSRSLGDFHIPTIPITDFALSQIKDSTKFLLLATDGFWDVILEEELAKILNAINYPTDDAAVKMQRLSIVRNISNYIQRKRGKDNASFILVFLN